MKGFDYCVSRRSRPSKYWLLKIVAFDLIFLDPPFEAGILESTIAAIADHGLLKEAGWLIAEHPERLVLNGGGLPVLLTRNYGDISLTICRMAGYNDGSKDS